MIKIQNITDPSYRKYGKVLEGYDLTDLLAAMEAIPCTDEVVYEASVEALEQTAASKDIEKRYFGGLPVQTGFCNGHNSLLNALEYHRSGEVNVAVTDLIVLLGHVWDVEDDFTYDTSKVEAFFVPAGTAFEMYETTLHYAPCGVGNNGFKNVVILPKGVNAPIAEHASEGEYGILACECKWLIAHKDAAIEGAFNGLKGENISVL